MGGGEAGRRGGGEAARRHVKSEREPFFLFFFQNNFIYIILHFITFILTNHTCSIHNERHKPLSNTKIHNYG